MIAPVGDNVIFANTATLGGHAQVGDFVILGGLSAVHQWGRVGRHAFVGGMAAVVTDVIPYAWRTAITRTSMGLMSWV